MNLYRCVPWAWLLTATLPGLAQEAAPPWQIGAFGTLGVMATDTHKMGYYRDINQPADGATDHLNLKTDSRLGLQVTRSFSDTFSATAQVVSRLQWDGSFKPEVNWAFLKWSPTPTLDLRAGRLGVEFNSMGDARDVGYSYLPVRPPQELYGKFGTNNFTGMDVTSTFPLGGALSLRVKAWGGSMVGKSPLRGYDQPLRLDGNPTGGLTAELSGTYWRFKASWSTLKIKHDWPGNTPAISDYLDQFAVILNDPVLHDTGTSLRLLNMRHDYFTGMFAWERGPLQFQVELERTRSDRLIFPDNWSGMTLLGYRLGKVVPYAMFGREVASHPEVNLGSLPSVPVQGPLLADLIRNALHFTKVDQATISAGARWDFRPGACLKFQVDQVKTFDSNGFFFALEPGWNGKARVFSVTLDFVFGGGGR